jgi:hypothetical protein
MTLKHGRSPYLIRAMTRRTCPGSHTPFPVAVGTPRLLSSMAIPYHDVTPPRYMSAATAGRMPLQAACCTRDVVENTQCTTQAGYGAKLAPGRRR